MLFARFTTRTTASRASPRISAHSRSRPLFPPPLWTDPINPGQYFTPPQHAVTDRLISIAENKWDAEKELHDIFQHIKLMLTQIFEDSIPDASHTGPAGMGQRGFGTLTPDLIMTQLMTLYGKPSLNELDQALSK